MEKHIKYNQTVGRTTLIDSYPAQTLSRKKGTRVFAEFFEKKTSVNKPSKTEWTETLTLESKSRTCRSSVHEMLSDSKKLPIDPKTRLVEPIRVFRLYVIDSFTCSFDTYGLTPSAYPKPELVSAGAVRELIFHFRGPKPQTSTPISQTPKPIPQRSMALSDM